MVVELAPIPRGLLPTAIVVTIVLHPCFNGPHMALVAETDDRAGDTVTTYSVKILDYITPTLMLQISDVMCQSCYRFAHLNYTFEG